MCVCQFNLCLPQRKRLPWHLIIKSSEELYESSQNRQDLGHLHYITSIFQVINIHFSYKHRK